MKDFSLLVWITQLGLSVVFPLGGFLALAVWLRDRWDWGMWVIWAGIVLGFCTACSALRANLKAMGLLAKEEKKEPPLSFNEHE
jgi:hypothetical protein